jgi:hypothetical protein
MSPDTDRIAVPTNGRGPHPATATTGDAAGSGAAGDLGGATDDTSDEALAIAFSPKQLAIGFAILASLLGLVAGWARRRSSR